jgi:hypothetical protein
MSYLERLDSALRDCGFGRRRRRRIVAEFADHLQEDPSADLGAPELIAGRFADALGTHRARAAALVAFAALTFAGIMVALRGASMLPLSSDGSRYDIAALLTAFVAGQVAFASGVLAALRDLRLRREQTITRRDAVVLARRAGVGLAAGAITIIAFPLHQQYPPHPGVIALGDSTNWIWPVMSLAAVLALAAAAPSLVQAARLRPLASGPAGDLLTDLGPLAARTRTPTRFALLFAGSLTLIITLAGIATHDPYDGAIRGLLEGTICLASYSLLGRYLGLRS